MRKCCPAKNSTGYDSLDEERSNQKHFDYAFKELSDKPEVRAAFPTTTHLRARSSSHRLSSRHVLAVVRHYAKLITQPFGDRMIIASHRMYSSQRSAPATPYALTVKAKVPLGKLSLRTTQIRIRNAACS